MHPFRSNYLGSSPFSPRLLQIATLLLFAFLAPVFASAQDVKLGVTYICNGEHIWVDSCNIRDTSDNGTCMVEHPDHVNAAAESPLSPDETRGSLKKRLPSCQQPSAKQVAAADAFHQKQQDTYDANVAKANQQMAAASRPVAGGGNNSAQQIAPPKNAEEREIRRCVSSGRLPATCTGNSLLGAFGQMISQVLPSANKQPAPGPELAGAYEGAGSWRLDFIDGGVLVNCSFLAPNQEAYTLDFKTGHAVITINTRPKPLVLTLKADGSIASGPGPIVIDGVVASGTGGGGSTPGHYETQQVTTHQEMGALEAQTHAGESGLSNTGGGTYDLATTHSQSTYVPGSSSPTYATFSPRRATCPAINVSTKGARVGVQTMQTDLLKSMFNDGDKGPATPAGIRMHGIYAASTGFSLEFFPESVILGCGPDSARAYSYSVVPDSSRTVVRVAAPDHPLDLAFKSDGGLDPGSSAPYQVHGRIVTGQNDNGDFTFAPLETSCNLAALSPASAIPSSGGTAATVVASAAGAPANASLERQRDAFGSRNDAGQCHAFHRLRIPGAARRTQSSRR